MAEITPSQDAPTDLENRRRRLIFRANHRGIKEADIILGSFVLQHVETLNHDDLRWFEKLFEEPDQQILAWIMGNDVVPAVYQTPMMERLQRLDYIPHNAAH